MVVINCSQPNKGNPVQIYVQNAWVLNVYWTPTWLSEQSKASMFPACNDLQLKGMYDWQERHMTAKNRRK